MSWVMFLWDPNRISDYKCFVELWVRLVGIHILVETFKIQILSGNVSGEESESQNCLDGSLDLDS